MAHVPAVTGVLAGSTDVPTITAYGSNYRRWSDGKLEQWGETVHAATTSTGYISAGTVFPIAFKSVTAIYCTGWSTGMTDAHMGYCRPLATGIDAYVYKSNSSNVACGYYWYAIGTA